MHTANSELGLCLHSKKELDLTTTQAFPCWSVLPAAFLRDFILVFSMYKGNGFMCLLISFANSILWVRLTSQDKLRCVAFPLWRSICIHYLRGISCSTKVWWHYLSFLPKNLISFIFIWPIWSNCLKWNKWFWFGWMSGKSGLMLIYMVS